MPEVLAPGVPVAESSDAEGRRCSECGGPIPLEFHTNRKTCSTACSDRREVRQSGSRSRQRSPRKRAGLTAAGGEEPSIKASRAAPATVEEPDLFGLLASLASRGLAGPGGAERGHPFLAARTKKVRKGLGHPLAGLDYLRQIIASVTCSSTASPSYNSGPLN